MSDILNTGESLSFYQLFKEKNYTVEIPIIQRDYAQGRDDEYEVRQQFLDTFYSTLCGEGISTLDLDFIYGSCKGDSESIFIPLDGQQRLTTLFLLHWYIANVDNRTDDFQNVFSKNGFSKFSYETRSSAKEFCDALVGFSFNKEELKEADENEKNSLSKTIMDNSWFYSSWLQDPSIQSMLVMLDAINDKFSKNIGIYDKIINTKNPLITFQFLNLNEFKLTDDLYIKMNSRGKPLTPFENFKAKFEQHIDDVIGERLCENMDCTLDFDGIKKQVSVRDYFSYKIDTDWSDLFWPYRDKEKNIFDSQLMRFIRVFATIRYVEKCGMQVDVYNSNDIIEYLRNNKRTISFLKYMELGCIDEEFICDLLSYFDMLKNGEGKIKRYLSDSLVYDEEKMFTKIVQDTKQKYILEYKEYVQLYAFFKYLRYNSKALNQEQFFSWIRVVRNFTENQVYNSSEDLRKSFQSIIKLLPYSSDIITYLANNNNVVDGFYSKQLEEERIKAILILRNNNWKKSIVDVENHRYFKGQVGFLLKFSGILDYYLNNNNCDWSNDEDETFFSKFNIYCSKANAIFGKNGLRNFNDYIWERALLVEGDYLLTKGRNHSFLIDSDRDISWKRLLRGARENSGIYEDKRACVKRVFDKISVDNLNNDLKRIIDSSNVTDWRYLVIKNSKTIEECGFYKFIRKDDNLSTYVMLLGTTMLSGYYSELYSYSYYLRLLNEEVNIGPLKDIQYNKVRGTDEIPYIRICGLKYLRTNYCIDITYDAEDCEYCIEFLRENNGKISETLEGRFENVGYAIEKDVFSKRFKSQLDVDYNLKELVNLL